MAQARFHFGPQSERCHEPISLRCETGNTTERWPFSLSAPEARAVPQLRRSSRRYARWMEVWCGRTGHRRIHFVIRRNDHIRRQFHVGAVTTILQMSISVCRAKPVGSVFGRTHQHQSRRTERYIREGNSYQGDPRRRRPSCGTRTTRHRDQLAPRWSSVDRKEVPRSRHALQLVFTSV